MEKSIEEGRQRNGKESRPRSRSSPLDIAAAPGVAAHGHMPNPRAALQLLFRKKDGEVLDEDEHEHGSEDGRR